MQKGPLAYAGATGELQQCERVPESILWHARRCCPLSARRQHCKQCTSKHEGAVDD